MKLKNLCKCHFLFLTQSADNTFSHISKGATTVLKLGGPSAVGANSAESRRRRGWMWGRGCPPPHWRKGLGREPYPLPRNFLYENGEFWCILGGASALYVARPTVQESEAEEEGRERAVVKDDILH